MFYIILFSGILIDLIIGDPDFITHPVVIIGSLISYLESVFRKFAESKISEIISGVIIVLLTVSLAYLITYLLINFSYRLNYFAGLLVNIWLVETTIAIKGLKKEGQNIFNKLKENNLEEARTAVGRIVGRDTDKMSEKDIIRATIETIAENTADGIISPIFYYLIGGIPLAMAYKAVNTLDSMLGYKNKKYKNLGWAAARLDDVANFIPARITGIGYCLAALILGENWREGWQIMWQDGGKHPSWNAGYPEAAVAGILKVRLGGLNYYHGQTSFRAYLGEKIEDFSVTQIESLLNIMYLNVFLITFLLILLIIIIHP